MSWLSRAINALRPASVNHALDEEIHFHIAAKTADLVAQGVPHHEARMLAERQFGSTLQLREASRDIRTIQFLEDWRADIAAAARSLVRHRSLTLMNVLLGAASVGLMCTVFAVFDAVLLRQIDAVQPERLVMINEISDRSGQRSSPSLAILVALARHQEGASHLFGFRSFGRIPATVGSATLPVRVIGVVGDYFTGLGRAPLHLGRVFDPTTGDPVALISYAFWRDRFGSDPGVIGRTITLGLAPLTIVAVGDANFVGTQPDTTWEVMVPFDVLRAARGTTLASHLREPIETVARLKPGVSPQQFQSQLQAIWPDVFEAGIPDKAARDAWLTMRGASHVQVAPFDKGLSYGLVTNPGLPRALTLGIALAVLVVLAGLLTMGLLAVARIAAEQRQTAIRMALGGTRWRVARLLWIECAMVSVVGVALGLLLARWGAGVTQAFLPGTWRVGITAPVAWLAVVIGLVTIGFGGLLSAFAVRGHSNALLPSGAGVIKSHLWLRGTCLALQFAVALALVHSSVLYGKELRDLDAVSVGFNMDRLHQYTLSGRLPERGLDNAYFERLLAEVRAIPGVDTAGMTGAIPPLGYLRDVTVPVRSGAGEAPASSVCAFPGYLDVLGVPLQAGRDLTWTDGKSAVITASLARALLPSGGSAVGRQLDTEGGQPLQIVGVAGDIAYHGPRLGPRNMVIVPCLTRRSPWPSSFVVFVLVRSSRGLTDLGRDVSSAIERAGVHYVAVMDDAEDIHGASLGQERLLATVSGTIGGAILILTALALFGFANYMLTLRDRELAIRGALGAAARHIVIVLMRELLVVLAVGAAVGLCILLVLQRVLGTLVVSLPPLTAATYLGVLMLLASVGTVAVLRPALRAMRLDLVATLRTE